MDPGDHENILFQTMCVYGNLDIIKLLLDDPCVDPTCNDNLPFRRACEFGSLQVVELLIISGRVNPSYPDNKSFRNACKKWARGNSEITSQRHSC